MKKSKDLAISFGLLCGTLATQLKEQGIKYAKGSIQRFELQRKSIYHLYFGEIITDSQKDKMLIKLMKNITNHVRVMNK